MVFPPHLLHLGAANTFYQNGITDFLILEGRNRIGGRSHTSYDLGMGIPVDLGSAWIQGRSPEIGRNPILTIATQHKINFAEVAESDAVGATHSFFNKNSQIEDCKLELLRNVHLKALFTRMGEQQRLLLQSGESDISLRQFVNEYLKEKNYCDNSEARQLFEAALHATIVTEYAADLEDLSMFHWNELDHLLGGDCYMAVEGSNSGFTSIVHALAKPFCSKIQKSSKVEAIEYHGEEVLVTYSCENRTQQISAKHVIVTLPLGVLKSNLVKFFPPLPFKKQMAIDRLGNGICNKCVLCWNYDDFVVFWPKEKDWIVKLLSTSSTAISSGEDAWLEFYNAYKYNGNKPVLVGYSGGRDASTAELLTDEEITRDAVASLRRMFGNVPEPTRSIVTRWESDEFSRGSFSFLAVGCTRHCRQDLQESVDGKLFFAGEATETHFPSTTQGALISGEISACEVMDELKLKTMRRSVQLTVQ